MTITAKQIQKIHALLPIQAKKDKEFKESIVMRYTKDDSKYSTKDLTFEQANELIVDLGGKAVLGNWASFDAKKESHRRILSILQQAGWVKWNKKHKRHFADMGRFGNWLQTNKSPVKKPLTDQSKEEVSKTIVALEGVLESELKKQRR